MGVSIQRVAVVASILLCTQPALSRDDKAGKGESRSSAAGAPAGTTHAQAKDDPVHSLNTNFRAQYAAAKKNILKRTGPILVVSGGKIIVVDGDKQREFEYSQPVFHLLKTVEHAPLAVFVMLDRQDGKVDAATITSLKELAEQIKVVRTELAKSDLDKDILTRQYQILNETGSFIDGVCSSGTTSPATLSAFTAKLAPVLVDTIFDAVSVELAALDKQVQAARATLSDEQWRNIHVVVTGSHVASQQSSTMQYFYRLLDEPPMEGRRVIYLEGGDGVEAALNTLATHLLDADIGVAFWGDSWRMHRDLLSDAASRYLDEHHSKR